MISSGKCSRLTTRCSVEFERWTCRGTIDPFSPVGLLRQSPSRRVVQAFLSKALAGTAEPDALAAGAVNLIAQVLAAF